MHRLLFLIKAKTGSYKQWLKIKPTKKFIFNASKVSHFTNFNRFTKENEILKFYMNTIYGYRNFFHFTYQDPISEIINNWEILEIFLPSISQFLDGPKLFIISELDLYM